MTIALVEAGARVCMVDVNDDWLHRSADYIRKEWGGHNVITHLADVSDPNNAKSVVTDTINELDGLHILINNAGIMRTSQAAEYNRTNFWEITPKTWADTMTVNANGPFFMANASAPHMIQQKWGRIIGVTTSIDSMYRQGLCPYGPSKASHEALIALMSRELEGTGVTANVLIPGGTSDTNLIPQNVVSERSTLLKPQVMNAPAVWLASEKSGSINGQRIIAYNWDETLPIEQRLEKSSAPAAWPQLGQQAINPWS
jgi:NAD(P)-dependent dehydrogenase (short-subunit alcohol dehydrogenase family)